MEKLTLLRGPCLSPKEVQALLQVDIRVVYRWLNTGELKALKINNRWHIPEPHLDEIIHANYTL
jgi:predicted site-specific integrase-resolvase